MDEFVMDVNGPCQRHEDVDIEEGHHYSSSITQRTSGDGRQIEALLLGHGGVIGQLAGQGLEI
jgi:hypothetical protein